MQTVKDFVTTPDSGLSLIDETPMKIPLYMVNGTEPPVAVLERAVTIDEVTQIPTPWAFLWCRPATRDVR